MFSESGSKFSNFGNFNPLLENIDHPSLKAYSKYRKYLSIESISYSGLFHNDIDPLYADTSEALRRSNVSNSFVAIYVFMS